MNKVELVSAVVEVVNADEKIITKKDATTVVDVLISVLTDALVAGEEVKIAGLGKFSVTTREAHTGRNPKTSEAVEIEAKKSPKFKASSVLKGAVNA